MNAHEKIKTLNDNGIKIYPKFDIMHRFAVCIEDPHNLVYSKKKNVGEFKHTTRTINKAILEALDFVHEKLTKNNT